MDTEQAYGKMQEANRIIEDFPIGKYALYTVIVSRGDCDLFRHCLRYLGLTYSFRMGISMSNVRKYVFWRPTMIASLSLLLLLVLLLSPPRRIGGTFRLSLPMIVN